MPLKGLKRDARDPKSCHGDTDSPHYGGGVVQQFDRDVGAEGEKGASGEVCQVLLLLLVV